MSIFTVSDHTGTAVVACGTCYGPTKYQPHVWRGRIPPRCGSCFAVESYLEIYLKSSQGRDFVRRLFNDKMYIEDDEVEDEDEDDEDEDDEDEPKKKKKRKKRKKDRR